MLTARASIQPPSDGPSSAMRTFMQCGLGVARGLLGPAEIDTLVVESERLGQMASPTRDGNGTSLRASASPAAQRLDGVEKLSDAFAALNRDPRILDLAALALGVSPVFVASQLVCRWPGAEGYPARRGAGNVTEIATFHVLLALDNMTFENGTTEFFPGLRLDPGGPDTREPLYMAPELIADEWSLMPELDAGDAAVFEGGLPHRAGRNDGGWPSRSYLLTFASAGWRDRHPRPRRVCDSATNR